MKRVLRTGLTVVLAVVFLCSCFVVGKRLYQGYVARQDYEQLSSLMGKETPAIPEETPVLEGPVVDDVPEEDPPLASAPEPSEEPAPKETAQPAPVPTPAPTPVPVSTPAPTAAPAQNANTSFLGDIDLEELRKVNPDVIGWITIPGTSLSYPLVQGEDNQYYLDHTWKKAKNVVGAIYLDYRNDPMMGDFNSIIYGHRMSSDSMFNCLRYYSDSDYWEKHPSIYIVTDEGVLCYDVFAAYEADVVNGHTYRLGLKEADGQQAYINYCSRRSLVKSGVIPRPGDHIITLSTCVGNGSGYDTRWVVQAVRSPSV